MRSYIVKRLALFVPLILGITMITFALIKALPGDPVYTLVGERSSPQIVEKVRKEIGTDKGLGRQFLGYLMLLAKGEMGRSYYTNRLVLDDIKSKLPKTLGLAVGAMTLAVPFGILLGLFAAIRQGGIADRLISAVSIVFMSMPVFWSGLLLMLFFSFNLKVLPPSGTGGLRYLLLPSLTLALPAFATIARVTRVSVLDVTGKAFIRTARAKGIRKTGIYLRHILTNALVPVVTVIGLDFGSYLNGAVLTETIFGWDGIGRFTMEGIVKRDYPVIMGCIVVGTALFAVINLVVDIVYYYVDPRIRIHGPDR